jgi:hypothetical protein
MKKMLMLTLFLIFGLAFLQIVFAWQNKDYEDMAPNSEGLLGPYRIDAYGPGIHSDATGRPFHWETEDGQTIRLEKVKPDVYGPGVGMDEYGRPVRAKDGMGF